MVPGDWIFPKTSNTFTTNEIPQRIYIHLISVTTPLVKYRFEGPTTFKAYHSLEVIVRRGT